MITLFEILLAGMIALVGVMLYRVLRGPSVYDRLNGVFAICTDMILIILLIGYSEDRPNMYIDIAISYAALGFITSVIITKFIGVRSKND